MHSHPPALTPQPTHTLPPPSINQMLSVQKSGVLFTTPDLRRLAQAWEAHSAEYRVGALFVMRCVYVCVYGWLV